MCLSNFHPKRTKLGVSGTCSRHYLHRVFWQLVLCMYSPSSLCGVDTAGNQSHPFWQNNRSYMGPLTPVDPHPPVTGRGANSGPNHRNHPLCIYCWLRMWKCSSSPGPQKCRVSHPVTIWTVGDMLTWIPVVATNVERSISLTTVLVPNCLNKGTLILNWNMSDITKISVSSEKIVTALCHTDGICLSFCFFILAMRRWHSLLFLDVTQ